MRHLHFRSSTLAPRGADRGLEGIRALVGAGLLTVLWVGSLNAQWTQGAVGRVWAKTTFFFQKTDERFDAGGSRAPWIGSGEADSRALFTDVVVGVLPSVDVWVQVPYFDLRFHNPADSLRTTGFGDIRWWVRWKVTELHDGKTPIAVRVGAKAPVGSSPLDAQIIPVGEGQWDLEFFSEFGHSFWPTPVYAEVWLGWRARLKNTEKRKDPGGEFVFLIESGVNPTPWTLLKATLDGFLGRKWTVEGIETNTSREILTLQLAAGVRTIGPAWLESGVRLPLSGQDFPAGPQLVLALSGAFSALGR